MKKRFFITTRFLQSNSVFHFNLELPNRFYYFSVRVLKIYLVSIRTVFSFKLHIVAVAKLMIYVEKSEV